MAVCQRHVRFTPQSRHQLSALECPLCADFVAEVATHAHRTPLIGSADKLRRCGLFGLDAAARNVDPHFTNTLGWWLALAGNGGEDLPLGFGQRQSIR